MYNASDKSKTLSPWVAKIVGLLVLAMAGCPLWMMVEGVRKGEVYSLSKHHNSSLVVRRDNPGRYWFVIGNYGAIVGVLGITAVPLFKPSRKKRDNDA